MPRQTHSAQSVLMISVDTVDGFCNATSICALNMIGPSLLSRWVRAKWLHRMICRETVINYWLFARCAFPESFLILDIHDFNAMIPNTAFCLSSFGSAEHRWFHVVSPVDRKLVLRWNLRYYVWIWLRTLNITSHINQVIWYFSPVLLFATSVLTSMIEYWIDIS